MSTSWWKRLFGSIESNARPVSSQVRLDSVGDPPDHIEAAGTPPLQLRPLMRMTEGLPHPDWATIDAWVDSIPVAHEQAAAWARCELGWLQHLRFSLGPDYRLHVTDREALLSTLDTATAQATTAFVAKSRARIARALEGLAEEPKSGYDIVMVLEDEETYYRYVSHHYPDGGHFARSSGMYLGVGCGHFITVRNHLHHIEPVIVHELTHALLNHLPLPTWINEGLAVNTEHRFHPPLAGAHLGGADSMEQHARHQAFWTPDHLQQFWSGEAFHRPGQGQELAYDLARILTAQLASDWPRFTAFARSAHRLDAGAYAAQQLLGIGLGQAVCALLERDYTPDHEPTEPSLDNSPSGHRMDATALSARPSARTS